ncbi:MAG: DUF302 domain-containing protein [Erythrobacter sp.]|nr:DUF302 domain-containing protein [Erythrobacter sp.]MBO6528876.1 DUF302 domain-containing protein [Erythrobacter sp.]
MPQVERALADQGFGIITRIDMSATLQDKLGKDFRQYTILGACNPEAAYAALQLEDKVGTMLPCNVIVQQVHKGLVEVAAIDPVASMQAIDNPDLDRAAHEIRDKLAAAINMLGG